MTFMTQMNNKDSNSKFQLRVFHRVFLHRSTTRPRPERPPDDGVDSSHAAAGLGLTHATHAAHAVG